MVQGTAERHLFAERIESALALYLNPEPGHRRAGEACRALRG